MTPFVRYDLCTGCGACAEAFPILFEMRDERAWLINYELYRPDEHEAVERICPFGAITVE